MFIQSRMASSESHNIRMSTVHSSLQVNQIGHSRSFQVILIGVGRNSQRRVVVTCD